MKIIMGFFLVFVAAACSTGHCRRDGSLVPSKVDAKPPTGYTQENLGSILVGKSDGSLQCDMKMGLTLEEMAENQLTGIKIFSSRKAHDGLVRIQTCGVETGMMNLYEIQHQDLSQAHKAGFTVIKNE